MSLAVFFGGKISQCEFVGGSLDGQVRRVSDKTQYVDVICGHVLERLSLRKEDPGEDWPWLPVGEDRYTRTGSGKFMSMRLARVRGMK